MGGLQQMPVLQLVKLGRDVLTAPAEGFCHPDQFVNKRGGPFCVGVVEQIALVVKFVLDAWKIEIGKCHGEAKLADHRDTSLNDAGAAQTCAETPTNATAL